MQDYLDIKTRGLKPSIHTYDIDLTNHHETIPYVYPNPIVHLPSHLYHASSNG